MPPSGAEGGVPALWRRAVSRPHPLRFIYLPLLQLLSIPWRIVVWGSHVLYRSGIRHAREHLLPVISVGNLTVGGTGKTTTCIHIARELARRDVVAGIVLRGYGRRGNGALLVSDGQRVCCSPEAAGDEALLLARRLPGCPVAVCKRREQAIRLLATETPAQVAILDDGYQYYRLARVVDLVLLDAFTPEPADRLFPAGFLREPFSHLVRATDIWLTHCDIAEESRLRGLSGIAARYAPSGRLAQTAHVPQRLEHWDGTAVEIGALRGRPLVAFAGIGNPESFFNSVETLSGTDVERIEFADHYAYRSSDWDMISAAARRIEAAVVTTPKDAVKMPPPPEGLQVYVLSPALRVVEGQGAVDDLFDRVCRQVEEWRSCRHSPTD